jgi:hypothetical protein
MSTNDTTDDLNAYAAGQVRKLHDALAAAGHPVTPAEAKVIWLAGMAATCEVLELDGTPFVETARRVAADLG